MSIGVDSIIRQEESGRVIQRVRNHSNADTERLGHANIFRIINIYCPDTQRASLSEEIMELSDDNLKKFRDFIAYPDFRQKLKSIIQSEQFQGSVCITALSQHENDLNNTNVGRGDLYQPDSLQIPSAQSGTGRFFCAYCSPMATCSIVSNKIPEHFIKPQ